MATQQTTSRYERESLRDRAAEMTAAIQRYAALARSQGQHDLADRASKIWCEAKDLFESNWERTR